MVKNDYYADGREHLNDELRLLDVKIHILLKMQQFIEPENPLAQFKGLILSEDEIYRLLEEDHDELEFDDELSGMIESRNIMEKDIREKVANTIQRGSFLPLNYVLQMFHLSAFEQQCVLICLAPEVDRKYEKLYSFLQDDVTCKYPTADLIMKLACSSAAEKLKARLYFRAKGMLQRYLLRKDEDAGAYRTVLTKELRLDKRIVALLLEPVRLDDELSAFASLHEPKQMLPPLIVGQDLHSRIRNFVSTRPAIFYLWGNSGSGKKLQVKHYSQHVQKTLLIVDFRRMLEAEKPLPETLAKIFREAYIQQALLCFDHFEAMLSEQEPITGQIVELWRWIEDYERTVFILSAQDWQPEARTMPQIFIKEELPVPKDVERRVLWEHFSAGSDFEPGVDWGAFAGKFRFTPGQIAGALNNSREMAGWFQPSDNKITINGLHAACYSQVRHNLQKKALRLKPRYGWEDIILPAEQKEQLYNACSHMKYRHIVYGDWGFDRKLAYGKGLSMLFSGPPGTGKTMSAEVIANELQLELYKIDLSQIISKYIGETEKNLQEVFEEAQLSNAILFFDETDALFGKRSEVKDAHDKYANVEVAYLLQKMEEYEGVTVLATNFLQNIDEAFMRRINFVIKFPFPDAEFREKIWRGQFPCEAPLDEDIDFRFIAERLEIAGGNIKNIAVSAAFLAAERQDNIGMKHILRAAEHELNKSGKILMKNDFIYFD